MASTILGRVGFLLKGTWSSTTSYETLDVVSKNGNSFAALKPSLNIEPPNDEYWQAMTENQPFIDAANQSAEQATQAAASASKAIATANTAANAANQAASNANSAAQTANSSANQANQAALRLPKIGENGNWYLWNFSLGEYTDSGVAAGLNGTGKNGNILIGPDAEPSSDSAADELNIGNLIKGSLSEADKYVEIDGGLRLGLIPTSDPGISGAIWNDGGVLKVSDGVSS